MKLKELLIIYEHTAKIKIADYNTEQILFEENYFTTPKENYKSNIKKLLDSTVIFLYAYDNRKIKIFIDTQKGV